MKHFPTALESREKLSEPLEISKKSKERLSWAIECAIREGRSQVEAIISWYEIEEQDEVIAGFLKQKWYTNVQVKSRWYSCFSQWDGETHISFSF